jgi:hypothetical protein
LNYNFSSQPCNLPLNALMCTLTYHVNDGSHHKLIN